MRARQQCRVSRRSATLGAQRPGVRSAGNVPVTKVLLSVTLGQCDIGFPCGVAGRRIHHNEYLLT